MPDEYEGQVWPQHEYFFYVESLEVSKNGGRPDWIASLIMKGKDGYEAKDKLIDLLVKTHKKPKQTWAIKQMNRL